MVRADIYQIWFLCPWYVFRAHLELYLISELTELCCSSSEGGSDGAESGSEWLERAVANLAPQSTLVVMNKTDLLGEGQRPLLEEILPSRTDNVSERIDACVFLDQ